jgi:membrane-bound ClpP family serine protease
MGPIAIVFGALFVILGVVGFAFRESDSPTPLIPAAFGIVLIVLGLLARQDRLRMHVMHLAALVGLVAFVVPLVMVIRALVNGISSERAFTMQALMSAGAAVFLALCIKSFIDARRRRQQNPTELPRSSG